MSSDEEGEKFRRALGTIEDWKHFLVDAKEEFNTLFQRKIQYPYEKDDFEFHKTLGKGAFGRVVLSKLVKTNKFYATKILDKVKVVKSKQTKNACNEKRILQSINFPLCVHLKCGFLDHSYLYFCLPFIPGGEMFTHLRSKRKFDEELSKFYGAQILLAFEYLHYCDMIFRDLKPENILVNNDGYLKLTDFGFCKVIKGRTYTLCGTPEYLAPEIILNKGYGMAVDWWTYGVLLYEMAAGYPPFHANDPMKIYEKAVAGKYVIPSFFSDDLGHLVENLLQSDLTRRYGNLKNGINDIKSHPWYKGTHWLALVNRKIDPPYIPEIKGPDDFTHFDKYAETTLQVTKKNMYSKEFHDF